MKKFILCATLLIFTSIGCAKTLVWGTEATYPPFVSTNPQGKIVGMDADIATTGKKRKREEDKKDKKDKKKKSKKDTMTVKYSIRRSKILAYLTSCGIRIKQDKVMLSDDQLFHLFVNDATRFLDS